MQLYFSDFFKVSESTIEQYGAFNVSLLTDLPLFIDPFLLFNSSKPEYQQLHNNIIRFLRYLKDKSLKGGVTVARLKSLYRFPEIKQNWLGFCSGGNTGRGLGGKFANALNENLISIFSNFGQEQVSKSSHLEKLCLIDRGVGKDMISDFTTNLIKDYLLSYTELFCTKHLQPNFIRRIAIQKAIFSFEYGRWMPKTYNLPVHQNDFVILTPKDILTKDDIWINHGDLIHKFEDIPTAVENDTLREEINEYFRSILPEEPKNDEYEFAVQKTIHKYPQLIDFYIKYKEEHGEEATESSSKKVILSDQLYIKQFGELVSKLAQETAFFQTGVNTSEEAKIRIQYLKDVIENKGGHRFFYAGGKPIRRESDLQILYRFTWCLTPSDVSREVNDGRGPADFKISRGSQDKTIVEFKLACNSHLRKNLANQTEVYKKASDAKSDYKVILYFSLEELNKLNTLLKELKLQNSSNIFLIDARIDNKPSGSKAS